VLTNLIDNAVEYTPADAPIEINARASDEGVIVEVADRGPGVPSGTENRVFEKFFRIQTADNRHGIGLGLAIARGIVEAHGGMISMTNRPGGGAIFRFTLPVVDAPLMIDS
jgi:two-component system, OmpR family, sensor histidine kinase KdpD